MPISNEQFRALQIFREQKGEDINVYNIIPYETNQSLFMIECLNEDYDVNIVTKEVTRSHEEEYETFKMMGFYEDEVN